MGNKENIVRYLVLFYHTFLLEDPWGNISPEFVVHFDIQSCRAFAGEVQVSWNFGVWCWGMLRLDVKPYRKLEKTRGQKYYTWFVFDCVFNVRRCTTCTKMYSIWAGLIVGEWLYSYTSCRYDMVMVPDKRNSHRTHSRGSLYGNPRWCIPLPVSCNWWGGIPLHGCQMVSRDLETAEDIGRSCWWGTPSTSDICARGVKQRVAMESHHWHGSRLTSWLYNEKIWKVHTQNSCSRCSSRISPPWKWMYPQVSVLTLKGVGLGGGRNGASSQTTCWELTQLDPQFVKVSSKNDGYFQKGHDELTDHERFGVYRKETFHHMYWFDCIAIICNNKLQLSWLKLGGSILGWFKHMSYVYYKSTINAFFHKGFCLS